MKTLIKTLASLALISSVHAQGRGKGGGGGGGGMPADFHDKIHELFAHPEKIKRSVDIRDNGYLAKTTTSDPKLAKTLQTHVKQMSDRLGGGMRVRRWDPAFEEFFARYDEMDHDFKKLKDGVHTEVTAKSKEAIATAQNHAYIVFDFSSQGHDQMHQPHRTALDEDGGEANRFRGGPPDARAAKLAKTFGARSQEASDELIKTLGGQLKAAMKAGGPEKALPICKNVALPLTEATAKRFEGLTITRVSDRLRNPKNAADKTDLEALKHFKSADKKPKLLAHLTTLPDGKSVRFYRPLRISETCLKCHGDRSNMSENLLNLLEKNYPKDKAHGYKLGELRGLIRIERKIEQKK